MARIKAPGTLTAVLVLLATVSASQGQSPDRVSVFPAEVALRGADRVQQLVVTGHYAPDGLRDLTDRALFQIADPRIVKVADGGLLVPLANGTTDVACACEGKSARVAVTVSGMDREQPINFANEIVPLFSKLGCNAGACHGPAMAGSRSR
jgi:hypothetical protein